MANGLPIVSTKTGIEGLAVRNNQEVLIATQPKEFANKIEYILKNKRHYEKIRTNAYQLIDKYYNWEKIAQNLELIYGKLIKT
jgi:glycosyltransferase involved in cell wall biosynthesis